MAVRPGKGGSARSVKKSAAKADGSAGAKPKAGVAVARTAAKKNVKLKPGQAAGGDASRLIDQRIAELGGWRGEALARMRKLILEALPGVVEEWKWMGTPVWSHGGILCTGESYKQVVKLTFAKGAGLPDPKGLFNASLEGNTRRAIDIREGEKPDAAAFKALVKAAAAQNAATAKKAKPAAKQAGPVKLLSGGNPQIAKADGDAPVQAYIAAMPGWKSALGQRLDALIVKAVPGVRKAVKWNSPFYGVEGQGWFLSFHVLTRYVKVTFFKGVSLQPLPPGATERSGESRWIDLHEDDRLDEAQMTAWVKQAAARPGWVP